MTTTVITAPIMMGKRRDGVGERDAQCNNQTNDDEDDNDTMTKTMTMVMTIR